MGETDKDFPFPKPPKNITEGHVEDLVSLLADKDEKEFRGLLMYAHCWCANRIAKMNQTDTDSFTEMIGTELFSQRILIAIFKKLHEQTLILKDIRAGMV